MKVLNAVVTTETVDILHVDSYSSVNDWIVAMQMQHKICIIPTGEQHPGGWPVHIGGTEQNVLNFLAEMWDSGDGQAYVFARTILDGETSLASQLWHEGVTDAEIPEIRTAGSKWREELTERANRAVKAFRALQPALTASDKILSGKNWPATIALPGVVSEGTLRYEDLIPTFEALLRELDPVTFGALRWRFDQQPGDSEDHDEYLIELQDALNDVAPDGYYFGTIEGDGACYGFFEADLTD